jgi:hypothetical protein
MTAVIVYHSGNETSIIKDFLILLKEIPPENALPQSTKFHLQFA